MKLKKVFMALGVVAVSATLFSCTDNNEGSNFRKVPVSVAGETGYAFGWEISTPQGIITTSAPNPTQGSITFTPGSVYAGTDCEFYYFDAAGTPQEWDGLATTVQGYVDDTSEFTGVNLVSGFAALTCDTPTGHDFTYTVSGTFNGQTYSMSGRFKN